MQLENATLAKIIRKARISREISQKAMSYAVGVSQTQYSKLERGQCEMSAVQFFRAIDRLGVVDVMKLIRS